MKNMILYTVCSYLPEDKKIVDNLMPNIRGMEKWALQRGMDFKVFNKIPDEVEDTFEQLTDKWPRIKRMAKRRVQMRKAWTTKVEAFHDFYRSDYERMLFLDCDMMPRDSVEKGIKHNLNLFDFNLDNYFYSNLKSPSRRGSRTYANESPTGRPGDGVTRTVEEIFKLENVKTVVSARVNAQIFYLTKNYKHNISNLFSYKNLLRVGLLNWRCIREEIFMTYMLCKTGIINEIKPLPAPRLRLKDISKPEKVNYIYQNDWENIIL